MATEFNQFSSGTSDLITGSDPNCDVQIGAPAKLIFTNLDFEIATVALAETLAPFTAGVAAETVFPLPLIEEFADNSEDTTFYTSPVTGLKTFVKEGKKSNTYMIPFNPSLHKRLRSGLNGKSKRLFIVDVTSKIIGTSADGLTGFKGWKSGLIRVDLWKMSDGSNIAFTTINFDAESTVETEDQIAVIQGASGIKALNGIIPVTVSIVGTPSATSVDVRLVTSDGGTPIEGLTLPAEFSLLTALGAAQTIATVVPSTTIPGNYDLTGTGLVTGTAGLASVVELVGENYKTSTFATVTI